MKKLKLVMSIATMCLAIAVLCFGVLAATSVSYTIGGSISYVVNDVFATVTTRVYTSNFADKSTLSAEAQKYVDGTGKGVDTNYKFDFQTKGLDSETFNNTTGVADYPDNNTEGIKIAYNTTDKRTYFIVVSVTNNGDNIISAKSNTLDLKSANTETQSINKISSLAKGETGKIVFALMLDDITKSIDAGVPFEYTITLQNGEISIAKFSYLNLNNDNEFTVEKTQVLKQQIFTDSNFKLDDAHFDADGGGYLYNFKLSDIDTSFSDIQIQITFSTSNSSQIFIAPQCYANIQQLLEDVQSGNIKAAMGENTASAYYDLTEATSLNFCILIATEPTSENNLKIEISQSFTEGDFRYFATNNDTAWLVGPKDETISGNNGEITIPETFQGKPVVGLQQGIGLFGKCINIKKVIIQDNIEEIPMGCFYGSGIQEIVLGSSIKSIGDHAFSVCSKLASIEIPSSVTSIGYATFKDCSSLTSIKIPSSVTSIGNSAFYGCSGLTSITIPEGVTSIGENAFGDCSSLASITIPSRVTSIEYGTFEGCSKLASIEIPSSVTSIGHDAFSGCSGLTSITIPSLVTSIGGYAFSGCRGLTSITIPSSVTSIESSAFSVCSGLTSVTFEDGIQLTSIGNQVFYNCSSLTSIEIPNGVTSIGENAFYGCSSLTSITIPSSVTSIGGWAFDRCYALAEVYNLSSLSITAGGVKVIHKDINEPTRIVKDEINKLFYYVYETDYILLTCYDKTITDVTINSRCTSINQYAFSSCRSLTSIQIPSLVTSIGNRAFSGCSGLTSIQIPSSVTSIEDYAFSYCSSLASITFESGSKLKSIGEYAFDGCSSLTSITIPEGVTSIGQYAFGVCTSLTSITIPSSLTGIGYKAFDECYALAEVYNLSRPSITTEVGVKVKVIHTKIDDPTRIVKDEINKLCYYVYDTDYILLTCYDKTKTNVTIDSRCTSINQFAFYKCSSLTSITIPSSVTSIGNNAFYKCSGLTNVTFEAGSRLTSIGNQAFRECSGLTSITIPSSVTSIGDSAFNGCYALAEVYNLSGLSITAGDTSNGYVGYYAKVIHTNIDEPTRIVKDEINKLFYYVYNTDYILLTCYDKTITDVTIDSRCTSINQFAFYNCSSLTSITIPSSVTSIGKSAFYGCSSLTSVTFEAGSRLTRIEDYVFSYCSSLTSITIPEGVTSIGKYAFDGCSSLISITIPSSVTSIGDMAFGGYSRFTTIKFTGTQAEWNAISKANANIGSVIVVCTDGTIVL